MLTQTIEAGKRAGTVKGNDLKRVTVDTTAMEKNIAHPTDARLYVTARRKLVAQNFSDPNNEVCLMLKFRITVPAGVMLALMASHPAFSEPVMTHGVGSGDVTDTSAIVWSRADRTAEMVVRFQPVTGDTPAREVTTMNSADDDYTAQVRLSDLQSDTLYRYEVSFKDSTGSSTAVGGSLKTAPNGSVDAAVSFIWGGDLGGQTYCRKVGEGYSIFKPMKAYNADFYVANGDMIYADDTCPEKGSESGWVNIPGDFPSISDPKVDWENSNQINEVFYAHWRYNRADKSLQNFFEMTPMYAQWDDHEIINDFGSSWSEYPAQPGRKGFQNIIQKGRKSFFDYHPIDRNSEEPNRIYRSYQWGQNLEMFILDGRSYRSENILPDTEENNKTLLGQVQFEWLLSGLANSTATWKFMSSNVPLALPTGSQAEKFGRDAYADGQSPQKEAGFAESTGYERELFKLLRYLDKNNINNVVFLTTDIHFASQIRYERDFDGDGDTLLFYEFISGPLSAAKNPAPQELDSSLDPVYLFSEGNIFNFGTVEVTADKLSVAIRDETGRIRPGSERTLSAINPPN